MIADLCTLLTAQSFTGCDGVHALFIPENDPMNVGKARLVVTRNGGDRYPDLSCGNDDSLGSSNVTVAAVAMNPLDAVTLADEVVSYFDDATYPVTMGGRTLFNALVDMPEDDFEPPQDASDDWMPRVNLSMTLQHSPA